MNATKAIYKKCLISFLENSLIDKRNKESSLTFEEFSSLLWHWLCILKRSHKLDLFNQLKAPFPIKNKTNIGNLHFLILYNLGIDNYE